MSSSEPPHKRRLLDSGVTEIIHEIENHITANKPVETNFDLIHHKFEASYPIKCLCSIALEEVEIYIHHGHSILQRQLRYRSEITDTTLLFLNLITWTGQTYHSQLASGQVCQNIQSTVNYLIGTQGLLETLLDLIKGPSQQLQYSACQSLISLLPTGICGREDSLPIFNNILDLLTDLIVEGVDNDEDSMADARGGEMAGISMADVRGGEIAGLSMDDMGGGEMAGLGDDDDDVGASDTLDIRYVEYKACLLSVVVGLVSHNGSGGGGGGEEGGDVGENSCHKVDLGEEILCQEMQVKCLVIRAMDKIWPKFTSYIHTILSTSDQSPCTEVFISTAMSLWRSLISVRANLSFVTARQFSGDLPQILPLLSDRTPSTSWRSVLDTVSECLCYGTTLGLQSIPPQEPCQLAHIIIRLVRFNSFLSLVPYQTSTGFGGQTTCYETRLGEQISSQPCDETGYDKGLVQKMVLIVLKCVALTTREARVESSSGESDSSLSSRESVSSCGSDMIIIERTMAGMYKVLDSWIKQVMPVMPHASLQESLLHLLGEQDDVLIEGLLCLLDTHMALYIPGKKEPEPGPLDTNPTTGFLTLLALVSRDSSVLLDFLVSNETCFLLYILRYLKFIVKDWAGFVTSCDSSYTDAVQMFLDLKDSIGRLLSKSLFPYNIGPVYRLLDKVSNLHLNQKNFP